MGRHAVNRRIGCHDAKRPSLSDAGDPGRQEDLAQSPLGDFHRTALQTADRLALPGIVAENGHDMLGRTDVSALYRLDEGLRHPRAEKRVLAIRFLVAAQARVTNGLDHERTQLMDTHSPRFPGGGRINVPDQVQVPHAAQARPFREDGPERAHQAVGPFFRLEQRNAQSCLPHRQLLQFIKVRRLLDGTFEENRIRQREEAAGRPDARLALSQCELSTTLHLAPDIRAKLPLINAGHIDLPDLLRQRHPA